MAGAPADLLSQLREERDAWKALARLLERERKALRGRAPRELPEITSDKGEVIARLGALRQEKSVLDTHPDPQVRSLWQEIRALCAAARAENTINGTILGSRLAMTRKALGALKASAGETYGADGRTSVRGPGGPGVRA